jgi:hypothetical protein
MKTITTPAGTTGLAVEPWARGEVYAVAANWTQASAPVLTLGADGWTGTGRQVAEYGPDPYAALADELAKAMRASGERGEDIDDRAAELAEGADWIEDAA